LSDKTRVLKRENEFLENILKIEKEIKETKEEEIIFSNFISTFQLTNEEKEIIMSGEINHSFFEVFEKINQIQLECTKMLRNQYKSGIDIIDQVNQSKVDLHHRCPFIKILVLKEQVDGFKIMKKIKMKWNSKED
jgi:hypothetical protein